METRMESMSWQSSIVAQQGEQVLQYASSEIVSIIKKEFQHESLTSINQTRRINYPLT